MVAVRVGDAAPVQARAHVNGGAPQGSVLLPRNLTEQPAPLSVAVGQMSKV
jgi:hypothetical protein